MAAADALNACDKALLRVAFAPLVLYAMVASAAAVAAWIAWRPIEYLVSHTVSDDAFYYFQTARTISDGGGVSVDGEVWTNGFHPLWMGVLVPLYALGAGDEGAVHVALTISGAAVALSGVALYATARRLGISELASLGATALYLFHPVVTYMSVNGLETGLNLSVFIMTLYFFVRCWQEPATANQILVSAAAGVLVLSRTDYGLTAAAVLFALLLRARAEPGAIAALALPATVIVAPWFAWNVAVFGSPVQGSAGALPYVEHQLFPHPGASTGEILRHALGQLRDDGYDVLPYVYFTPHLDQAHYAVAAIGAIIVAAALLAFVSRDAERRNALALLAVPALGLAAQFVVHSAVRWYMREWYLVGVMPLLALLVAVLLDMLWRSRAGAAVALAVVAVVVASTIAKGMRTYRDGWYGLQADMLAAARWIDAETPPDARVGAFNSGIVGYFSHRTTVNIDGVMNPEAFESIRERRVAAYIDDREIDYLADFPFYPFWFYRPFLGADLRATEVARFDDHVTFQGPFTVYEIDDGPPLRRD